MIGIPEWAVGVGFIILAGSVGRALFGRFASADQLRRHKASRRHLSQAVEDLRSKLGGGEDVQTRLAQLEDVQRRLADVEERLDFAERMLAKQRDADRIAPPQR
jgi:hypothetical protein